MTDAERIRLRPVTVEDGEFLLEVYAAAREIEMAMVSWDETQKLVFLRQQLTAQTSYYASEFPTASHDIILFDDSAAGRLFVERKPELTTILDITVLPRYRKNGIGSALVAALLDEKRPVNVQVEPFNPSRNLFESLGFSVASDDGVNVRMRWTPR
ncbi:MAG: GNAT family N-acetyltransferase [Acidobacteriota bacterium]